MNFYFILLSLDSFPVLYRMARFDCDECKGPVKDNCQLNRFIISVNELGYFTRSLCELCIEVFLCFLVCIVELNTCHDTYQMKSRLSGVYY